MSETMCKHGYKWGTCPKGCQATTSDAPLEERQLLPPVNPISKLKCVICGLDVERGIVYKGRPLCGNCMKDLKGDKEVPSVIGGYPSEETVKKFPIQEKRLSAKDIKTPPE